MQTIEIIAMGGKDGLIAAMKGKKFTLSAEREKVCLIDTVKAPFAGELLERVREIVDPAKIDYVIVNHVEPDHSRLCLGDTFAEFGDPMAGPGPMAVPFQAALVEMDDQKTVGGTTVGVHLKQVVVDSGV